MPIPFPELVQDKYRPDGRLLPADVKWRLEETEWVPIVSSMRNVSTIGEHRRLVTKGVFLSAAYAGALILEEPKLVRVRLAHNFIARLAIDGLDVAPNPSLKSVCTKHDGIIYDGTYDSADGIVFSSTAAEHEAYADTAESLGEVGQHINQLAVDAVARRLNAKYPGFELPAKLEAQGIPVSI